MSTLLGPFVAACARLRLCPTCEHEKHARRIPLLAIVDNFDINIHISQHLRRPRVDKIRLKLAVVVDGLAVRLAQHAIAHAKGAEVAVQLRSRNGTETVCADDGGSGQTHDEKGDGGEGQENAASMRESEIRSSKGRRK